MAVRKSDNLHGRLQFAGYNRTWKEDFPLRLAVDYPTARTQLGKIATAYRGVMAAGVSIVYGSVSRYAKTPDRKTLTGMPMNPVANDLEATPPVVILGVDKVTTCFQVTYETDDGRTANRYIRGIRDPWVAAGQPTVAVGTIDCTVVPGAFLGAGGTDIVNLSYLINCIGYYTGRVDPASLNLVGLNAVWTPWTSANVVQATSRKTGTSFRKGVGRLVP